MRSMVKRARPSNAVLLHIGRCGSGVLSRSLRGHPLIRWDGEIFERAFQKAEDYGPHQPVEWHRQRDYRPRAELTKRLNRLDPRAYGFEMKFFHLRLLGWELDDFIRYCREAGINRFILLERVNRLRKIASSVHAHQTGVFHRKKEKTSGATPRPTIYLNVQDVGIDREHKTLLQLLEAYDADIERTKELLRSDSPLLLTYEDDVATDPAKAARAIARHLSVGARWTGGVSLQVTTPSPLKDLIDNYEEVEEYLRGTHYGWMLNE